VVPAADGASDLACDAPRVEAHGHDLVDVRPEQLRDAHLGLHAAAEPLESQEDAEQQRQISGDHEPVLVKELHATGDDAVQVELSDTDEQVAVEPGFDGTPQRAHVDVRRWGRELHHDVDERVDVMRADGDDERLELSPSGELTSAARCRSRSSATALRSPPVAKSSRSTRSATTALASTARSPTPAAVPHASTPRNPAQPVTRLPEPSCRTGTGT
jgi:hypothetical protein